MIVFIPQALLLVYSKHLLDYFEQPEDSANVAWEYLMLLLPGLLMKTQFECTRRYLLALGVFVPIMYIF